MATLDIFGQLVEVALDDGDVVIEAVVILRVVSPDRTMPSVALANTAGVDAALQIGLIEAARDITRQRDWEDI